MRRGGIWIRHKEDTMLNFNSSTKGSRHTSVFLLMLMRYNCPRAWDRDNRRFDHSIVTLLRVVHGAPHQGIPTLE